MSFDDNLSQVARRLRNSAEEPGPTDALRAKVLEGVRTTAAPGWQRRNARGWVFGSAAAVAMSALAATAFVQWHHVRPNPANRLGYGTTGPQTPAQLATLPQVKVALQVQQAVDKQKTWHFVGWQDNPFARQHWEIWGRAKPFLFREQIGDIVIIDDGTTRKVIVPSGEAMPSARAGDTSHRNGPLIYITSSTRSREESFFSEVLLTGLLQPGLNREPFFMGPSGLNQKSQPSAAEMKAEGIRTNIDLLSDMSYKAEVSENGRSVIAFSRKYSSASPGSRMTQQMRVDPQTHLPIQYSMLRNESGTAGIPPYKKYTDSLHVQSLLTAQYGVAIPRDIETNPMTADSQIVDMRPVMSQRISGNMSMRLSDIQRDRQGNVRVKLTPNFTNVFTVNPRLRDFVQVNLEHSAYASDTQGAIYPVTMMDDGQQPAAMVMWFTVPASAQAESRKTLTLHLPMNVSFYGPGGVNGPALNEVLNAQPNRSYDWLKVDVTLPPAAGRTAADIDLRPRYTAWRIGGRTPYSLAEIAAVAQARFYSEGGKETSHYRDPSVVKDSQHADRFYLSWPTSPSSRKKPLSDENRRLAAQSWNTAAAEAAKVGDTISAHTFERLAARVAAGDTQPLTPK